MCLIIWKTAPLATGDCRVLGCGMQIPEPWGCDEEPCCWLHSTIYTLFPTSVLTFLPLFTVSFLFEMNFPPSFTAKVLLKGYFLPEVFPNLSLPLSRGKSLPILSLQVPFLCPQYFLPDSSCLGKCLTFPPPNLLCFSWNLTEVSAENKELWAENVAVSPLRKRSKVVVNMVSGWGHSENGHSHSSYVQWILHSTPGLF